MFNLFKPKKIYCVRWATSDTSYSTYQDIVSAKDIAQAWNKVKSRVSNADYCISITDRKSTRLNSSHS